MTFRLALSGLNAATADLTVTANNIANTATTGFKGSRAEFAELFAVSPQGVSSSATGNGVTVCGRGPAVQPGQHRYHQQQPGPGDQRLRLLHAERRRRTGLHARRRASRPTRTATS